MGLHGTSSSKQPAYAAPPPPPRGAPDLGAAQNRVAMRSSQTEANLRKCEQEVATHKAAMQASRPGTAAHNAAKQRALRSLKMLKMYQQQLNEQFALQNNLDQVQFAKESLTDAKQHVDILQGTNKQMKQEMNKLKIADVENLADDMQDLFEDASEMQEALGRTYQVGDVDDSAISAELDEFESELMGDLNPASGAAVQTPAYLRPQAQPARPSADAELEALEASMGAGAQQPWKHAS